MAGLESIVELLAQPLFQLVPHAAHDQRVLVTLKDPQRDLELPEIGLNRARHPGVLQLTGERSPVEPASAVDLAERCRGCGSAL